MANQISINDFKNPELSFNAVAGEAILAGCAVNFTGTTAAEALVVTLADSGDYSEGIAANDAASGDPVTVIWGGEGKALVNSTTDIAAGDHLKPTTSGDTGYLILASTGNIACAVAMAPATYDGVLPVKVKIVPPFIAR